MGDKYWLVRVRCKDGSHRWVCVPARETIISRSATVTEAE